jgi:hypothetical protein
MWSAYLWDVAPSSGTLGAGVLSLAFATNTIGIVLMPFIFLIVLAMSYSTDHYMVRAAAIYDVHTMPVLAFKTLGLGGSIALDLTLIFANFGSLCGYYVLWGDWVPSVSHYIDSRWLIRERRLRRSYLARSRYLRESDCLRWALCVVTPHIGDVAFALALSLFFFQIATLSRATLSRRRMPT